MVVIIGRVLLQLGIGIGIHLALHLLEELHVGRERSLVGTVQSVQSHVLHLACIAVIVEGVGHAGAVVGHASPYGRGVVLLVAVDGHSALEVFLAILEDVLAHLTEVDVQHASQVAALVARIDVGVHHPELDVLDVLCLEVRVVQLAHHAAPPLLRVQQVSLLVHLCGEVVGAALVGVVGQVEHLERGSTRVTVLRLLRVEFAFIYLAHVVVRELFQVALDVAGRECAAPACEDGVDVVPCQQCPVVAVAHVVAEFSLGKNGRRAGQRPVLWCGDGHLVRAGLKVIQVGGSPLYALVLSGHELCELRVEIDLAGLRTMYEGQFGQHVGEPLALSLP